MAQLAARVAASPQKPLATPGAPLGASARAPAAMPAGAAAGAPLRAPDRSVKILAKSLFRELRSNGYDDRQIVALSTELISLLTTDMKEDER